MLELPETTVLAQQLNKHLLGKQVCRVLPPTKLHKFCWFTDDPADYEEQLRGCTVERAESFGIYVELIFSQGRRLCINDGVNVRLVAGEAIQKHYQLLIGFEDDTALFFTVAMYGGIILHNGNYDNEYYCKSRAAIWPFSEAFPDHYYRQLAASKASLSAKAFLATEQRFPGIGNGVVQDILLAAGIHPKRKISTLSPELQQHLLNCVRNVLADMIVHGGRDTEKDLFGKSCGYFVRLSKNTLAYGCPQCGQPLVKETYLGGAIYYCPACQPLEPN